MPLVLIPTPIGNMGDITLRALEELKSADVIACEDTRHSGVLLAHYGIKTSLISYQKFNEQARAAEILERLRRGEKVAVISDAGTPGMSDPGYVALKAAIEAGLPVDVLPGATAFVPAVLLSGLVPHPFTFIGFLSDNRGERISSLNALKDHPFTMVFYLSPHKASRQIADFIEVLGDRKASLVREISKVFQEAIRGTLSSIMEYVEEGVKGELVLVVEAGAKEALPDSVWQDRARAMREEGLPVKQIADSLSREFPVPKNKIKSWLMAQE